MESTRSGGYRGKYAFDLAVALLFAVPAILLSLICAAFIWCDDPGPVLLRQTRAGLRGQPFTMYKLRTMYRHASPDAEVPDEAMVTRVGRVLRRLSLDELPQLLNVARGTMSIVGPRPVFEHRTDRYDHRQRERLLAKPGLTGLAQVQGRNTLDWNDRTEIDIEYVRKQSLRLDLKIVARTFGVVFGGDGVTGHPIEGAVLPTPHARIPSTVLTYPDAVAYAEAEN